MADSAIIVVAYTLGVVSDLDLVVVARSDGVIDPVVPVGVRRFNSTHKVLSTWDVSGGPLGDASHKGGCRPIEG